jgi:hypothetical protein
MDLIFPSYMIWWVTVIDIPVIAALFTLYWRGKKDIDTQIDHLNRLLDTRHSQLRDSLSTYKLEVAKTYSTQAELRALEGRLVSHLLRIESKLDKQIERNLKG